MDTARLAAIRAREQAATPGPWDHEWTYRYQPPPCLICRWQGPPWQIANDGAHIHRWASGGDPDRGYGIESYQALIVGCLDDRGGVLATADAAFIAAARADVPDLLAEVERLRAGLARLRRRDHVRADDGTWAVCQYECQCGADEYNARIDALLSGGQE